MISALHIFRLSYELQECMSIMISNKHSKLKTTSSFFIHIFVIKRWLKLKYGYLWFIIKSSFFYLCKKSTGLFPKTIMASIKDHLQFNFCRIVVKLVAFWFIGRQKQNVFFSSFTFQKLAFFTAHFVFWVVCTSLANFCLRMLIN